MRSKIVAPVVAAAVLLLVGLGGNGRAGEAEALGAYVAAFPETKGIGVLYSEDRHEARIAGLEAEAKKRGLTVVKVRVPSVKEFPGALQEMKGKVDTFWVVDDEIYSLQETWNFLIMFTLRNKLRTVVETEKGLQYGGLFYCAPEGACRVNKRILAVLGFTVADGAGAIEYFEGSGQ